MARRMPGQLVDIVTSPDPGLRDRSLDSVCRDLGLDELLVECAELEAFRRRSQNLYERVRALFFLYAIHRFHLPARMAERATGRIPFEGHRHLLERRFEAALDVCLAHQQAEGPSDGLSSALAAGYRQLGFQTLADQVRRSVRSVRGNRWMFELQRAGDTRLRLRPELLRDDARAGLPLLRESTPVRMDLTHSAWSDIFFLGMDHPEGAKVLNVSIDLGLRGRDPAPRPPIDTYLRAIDEPVLRLVSVDLRAQADVREVAEVFDFAKDYLGLLKAAVIAAGLVPPGLEGSGARLGELLETIVGPGMGIEIASHVRGIPRGSRLAVSTNLLASLIALTMRATGQTRSLDGQLDEEERRLVVARAILGEWLGGSGGGWQDSGGLWPSIKLIEGAPAVQGDPEFGVSRGRLLPDHRLLDEQEVPPAARRALQESLVLVHGGMAQDVGPILEMVTEKYLLRSEAEWQARLHALEILDALLAALRAGDVPAIGAATQRNFDGPIQTIIPWATNLFTETLIERVRERFGARFWGFWMLGGMSGGGMGLLFDPRARAAAADELCAILAATRAELEHAIPFAMEPVVYDFTINEHGSVARLVAGEDAPLPPEYYTLRLPGLVRTPPADLTPLATRELEALGRGCRARPELADVPRALFEELFPDQEAAARDGATLEQLLASHGFDPEQHEQIRADLRSGRIGLARNRLPADTTIENVRARDVLDATRPLPRDCERAGAAALEEGSVAVVVLAGGAGSRWTQGAGVVKALNPFCRLDGEHRSFLEVHLAKCRRTSRRSGTPLPVVVTTSYLSHAPIERCLAARASRADEGPLVLSPGHAVGLRMVPMERDLRFAWEELPVQRLDEQAQKVRESLQEALIQWARDAGEASDYRDNVPAQCLHPVGHWYEIPNLLRNGTLARLLRGRPGLRTLLLSNADTVGVDVDAGLLGLHLEQEACLSFEVVPRRIEDRGGGLARVNGRARLVESLALPREEDEFRLSYYNSMTTWIDVERLLALFGLTRADLGHEDKVAAGVRALARRMPTYVTLKDVKKRWGHGHEDVFPLCQFEKLWGDMTTLPEADCRFVVVPRLRGQQLKEPAQLDGWTRDGSARYVAGLCDWE